MSQAINYNSQGATQSGLYSKPYNHMQPLQDHTLKYNISAAIFTYIELLAHTRCGLCTQTKLALWCLCKA